MTSTLQRSISLRQLRLVAVLGRELNLSRTAQRLHTTQPALSRSLAQLESLLETRLFDRTTKRISLTAAGASLLQHADRILAELELAQQELVGIRGGISGEVRIGLLPTFSADLLAQAIARARGIVPDVLFVVQVLPLAPLYDALLSGRVDLMLSHAELNVDLNRVEVDELYEEHSRVLVARDHPLARRRKVRLPELANQPWVLPPPDTPLRPKIDRLLSVHRHAAPTAARDVQTDSMPLALGLMQHAQMLWAVAARYAEGFERAGSARALDIGADLLSGPMCAFRLRGEPAKVPTRVLLGCLTDLSRPG